MTDPGQQPASPHEYGEDWSVGTVGNVVIMLWLSHPRIEGLDALDRTLHRAQRKHGRTNLLTVVDAGLSVRPLDSRTRSRTVEILKKHQNHLTRSAIVAGSESGIWGSLLRSTITAIDLVIRPSYENRVFGSTPRAAVWVAGAEGCSADWHDLVDATFALRADGSGSTGITNLKRINADSATG